MRAVRHWFGHQAKVEPIIQNEYGHHAHVYEYMSLLTLDYSESQIQEILNICASINYRQID